MKGCAEDGGFATLAGDAGGHFVLPARMRDFANLGVEDEEMSKQELAHIATLMYELQEYCLKIKPDDCKIVNKKGRCRVCNKKVIG